MSGSPGKRRKGGAGRGAPGEVRQLKKARKAALRAARSEKRGFDLGAVDSLLREFVRDDGDLMVLLVGITPSIGHVIRTGLESRYEILGVCAALISGLERLHICRAFVSVSQRDHSGWRPEVAMWLSRGCR